MDRKQFLKSCAGGLCGCAAAYAIPTAQAADASVQRPENDFVKQRYAKMLNLVRDRMKPDELADCLRALGGFCSSTFDATIQKYKGNVDDFIKWLKSRKTPGKTVDVTRDRERGVITMITDFGGECPCPLNSKAAHTPATACNCSLGWHTRTWGMVLQKNVRVELVETALSGGKRCIFVVHEA